MSVVNLDIEICNTGIILVGANSINSFDDDSREAEVCAQVYDRTKFAAMEMYPWRFTMKQVILSPIVGGDPLFGYDNSFQLPSDRLRDVIKPESTRDYRIVGDKIYTNATEFKMEYQYKADEDVWSESFRRYVEFKMAAIISMAVLEDDSRAQRYAGEAENQLRYAKSIDSQSQPLDGFDNSQFPLTAVRGS